MIYKIADSIISPLGFSTEETYKAVRSMSEDDNLLSAARLYPDLFGLPEPSYTSIIDEDIIDQKFDMIGEGAYTKLEKAAILAVSGAVEQSGIDPGSDDVIFILSSTKGNIHLLEAPGDYEPERKYLWKSAELIAKFFGNPNPVVTVSNACISGCVAQINAKRLLESKKYRYAVVVGADMLCKFIISGFQSFKSLSTELCKPFDRDRVGLNLGEAAAAIIYAYADNENIIPSGSLVVREGAICNDANHISGPSRTAEGLYRCLQVLNPDPARLAFVNAHGTSTVYNDDMESIAIERANLSNVPVNSLKGYFGHTLGTAGVLETIISARAIKDGIVLRSRGSSIPGTKCEVNLALTQKETDKKSFVKMLSGFGGCNAAILFEQI